MKRNWDAIRMMLMKIEEQPGLSFELYPVDFAPLDEPTAVYHLRMLHQAGLIEGECTRLIGGARSVVVTGLTWSGHELLDAVRSPRTWNMIREIAVKKGLDLSFETVGILARRALECLLKG